MKILILLALPTLAVATVYQIPLTKIESAMVKMMKAGTWKDHLLKKDILRATTHKSGKPYTQKVLDYEDVEYNANITIGTPGQFFIVILDTGSSYLWIPDITCKDLQNSNCEECHGPVCQFVCDELTRNNSVNKTNAKGIASVPQITGCHGKHKFNQKKSTTYVVNGTKWSTEYGDLKVTGFLGRDTVRFGTESGSLTVPRVTFGQATFISPVFATARIDGLFGLAFPDLNPDRVTPPFFEAIKQKLVAPLFTVFLLHRGFVHGEYGGLFTYGGIDTTNCGSVIAFEKLTTATFFQFPMTSIGLGSYKSVKNYQVVSDTGTSVIVGPIAVVNQIAVTAGAQLDVGYGCYLINCTAQPPDIELVIGGRTYKIGFNNYIIQIRDGKCCMAIYFVLGTGFGPDWILGDTFIRAYCHIYDIGNKRIGFALPKSSNTEIR